MQHFNIAILEVPTTHQEVLVSAFTLGLHGGPFFESLAKKPATDVLDVLARVEKYMNMDDAWLVKNNGRDMRKEGESQSSCKPRGE